MSEPNSNLKIQTVVGVVLLAVGIAVFAVRFLHEGAYAMPRGGNLFGGLGSLLLGGLLVRHTAPRSLRPGVLVRMLVRGGAGNTA